MTTRFCEAGDPVTIEGGIEGVRTKTKLRAKVVRWSDGEVHIHIDDEFNSGIWAALVLRPADLPADDAVTATDFQFRQ